MRRKIRCVGAVLVMLLAAAGCGRPFRVEPVGVRPNDWEVCHAYGEAEAADDRVRDGAGGLPPSMGGALLIPLLIQAIAPTPDDETVRVPV